MEENKDFESKEYFNEGQEAQTNEERACSNTEAEAGNTADTNEKMNYDKNDNEELTEYEKTGTFSLSRTCKMCIAVFLATFLGSFLAMYFVADKYMTHKHNSGKYAPAPPIPAFERPFKQRPVIPQMREFNDFERMFEKTDNFFNESDLRPGIRQNMRNPKGIMQPFINSPVKIKTEKEDDKYNVIISLKPFQNNPDKIKYEVSDDILSVYGKSQTQRKNVNTTVSFSQDFVLPDNANTSDIKKIQDGNKLIISVPLKD